MAYISAEILSCTNFGGAHTHTHPQNSVNRVAETAPQEGDTNYANNLFHRVCACASWERVCALCVAVIPHRRSIFFFRMNNRIINTEKERARKRVSEAKWLGRQFSQTLNNLLGYARMAKVLALLAENVQCFGTRKSADFMEGAIVDQTRGNWKHRTH